MYLTKLTLKKNGPTTIYLWGTDIFLYLTWRELSCEQKPEGKVGYTGESVAHIIGSKQEYEDYWPEKD